MKECPKCKKQGVIFEEMDREKRTVQCPYCHVIMPERVAKKQ